MKALILSNALDTNGQNARYVDAVRKHGNHVRVLKALAVGHYDPAGVVERFREAAERHGGLQLRSAHRTVAYFDFPHDMFWGRLMDPCTVHGDKCHVGIPELRRMAIEADVLHLNNNPIGAQKLRVKKPSLLHHHGSLFRSNPDRLLQQAKSGRMAQAVSTVDLMRPAPELLHWLPTAYDGEALRKHRRRDYFDDRVHIVHAPTNRDGKHTALFVKATDELIAEGLPIRVTIVENRTNAECLEIKGTADLVYDQLMWGYGCNSVEAWGMGIPVISGSDPWTRKQMEKMWGQTPYYPSSEKTLKADIKRLVESADMRAEWASIGSEHFQNNHAEIAALERLVELYHVALREYRSRRIPQKGARKQTFVNKSRRPIYVEGEAVPFGPDWKITTNDPLILARLQYFARTRKLFGIEEVA